MRIVIDMQGAQTESRFRGIGRYTMAFAQAVVKNRGEHEIILALSDLFPDSIEPIRAAFDGFLPQENIRVWHAPGPVMEGHPGNESRREVAELMREAFLASLEPDVIHISSLFEGYVDDAVTSIGLFDQTTPVSVILYDLIPLLNPNHYLKPNPRYEQYYLRKIKYLKQAKEYLAISNFSRQEAIDALGTSDGKNVVISTAIDSHFQQQTLSEESASKLRAKFNITRPFILYTGGSDERKNLPRLIEAYAALSASLRETYQLIFAGRMPEGDIARLKHIAHSVGLKEGELIFTGYVSDEELIQLYNLCQIYVFPSWHEGFGLPALEAMACGAPVIGANTSSLPEVIGLEEALFDPFDTNAITAKMAQALQDEAFRIRLREHGLQQAKKFSWNETAKRAIEAWESLSRKGAQANDNLSQELIYEWLLSTLASLLKDADDTELLSVSRCLAQNENPSVIRQLLVDVSELVQRDAKSGIQRVVRAILREWLENPPEGFRVEPIYATKNSPRYFYARQFTSRFLGVPDDWAQDEPAEAWPGDIFIGLDLQHLVVLAQKAFLQEWRNRGVKIWFVVYDLLPILKPQVFLPEAQSLHQHWLESISCFDGVACISRAVADEMREWLAEHEPHRERPLAIEWFHLGADVDASAPTRGLPDDANMVLDTLNARHSFLMVGTVEPRKGHAQVLEAFDLLWKSGMDVNLVIVGKQGWMVETLVERLRSHPELNKRLFWLEGISDEYLEKVYAASTCLIAASYGEGFGLPLIEAAQHKLPIIARDIPVFREVAGENAFFFNAPTSENLAQSIQHWLKLYAKNQPPISDAMPWLTWKASAQQLLTALKITNSQSYVSESPL
jgi:glycosyltransferase involved in cell wall biosynthesis